MITIYKANNSQAFQRKIKYKIKMVGGYKQGKGKHN
jgi:hypothetical protein